MRFGSFYKRNFELLEFYDAYERHIILKWLANKPGQRVLDLGSGLGNMLWRIEKKGSKGFGVELIKENVDIARKINPSPEYHIASADNIPFDKDFFDVIVSTSSLEHMENLQKVFKEAFRVLKDRGKFVFSIDCFLNLDEKRRKKYFRERGIVNNASYEQIKAMLEKEGFKVIRKKYLFKTKLASKLQMFGLKLNERMSTRLLVPLMTFFAYPLVILLDNLERNKGNVLIIEARK